MKCRSRILWTVGFLTVLAVAIFYFTPPTRPTEPTPEQRTAASEACERQGLNVNVWNSVKVTGLDRPLHILEIRNLNDSDLRKIPRFSHYFGLKLKIREGDLGGEGITDAGMKELLELKHLDALILEGTRVTGKGLEELLDHSSGLLYLRVDRHQVTDGLLRKLDEQNKLHILSYAQAENGRRPSGPEDVVSLDLRETTVTDSGLQHIKELDNLHTLWLSNGSVTDLTLKVLEENHQLHLLYEAKFAGELRPPKAEDVHSLFLIGTKITDAGLQHLKGLKNLNSLDLSFTQVTSEGLQHLKRLKNLKSLKLKWTRVSGVEDLRTALPECQIIR